LPTSEVLPGYKSGFSSLDSPLTPTSKTGFSSPDLGSEFYSVPGSRQVELTARALVGGCHVKNTMKQQLKTIFRNARPEDDRMFAAEGDKFDYRSKINPHIMPMPMIQAAMSAARGGTERDHFNLRSNFSGVDESKFLNYDVQSQFNRRKWKEEVAKQDQINQDMWRREEEEREERRQQLHAAREVLDEAIGFIEGLEMEQQKKNLDFFSANGWN
jgi:hypothetical protein